MKRKDQEARAAEQPTPLPDAPPASAFWVDGRLTWASIPAAPPRERHAGTCTCEACFAAWLADPGVRFY